MEKKMTFVNADDMKRAEDLAKSWSPGPGSLSDVLSDAEKLRKPG